MGDTPVTALTEEREALRKQDPVMRALIDAKPDLDVGAWRRTIQVDGLFEALVFQIIGQQISVSALNVIYMRFRDLFPGERPTPELVVHIPLERLRAIGLSTRKAEYIKDVASRAAAGELDGIEQLSPEEARGRLVALRGVGPWTADGALLIAFGWTDLLLAGDLVIRKAVQRAYDLPDLPTEADVANLGERWRPHRSLAAAYLFDLFE